MANSQNDNGSKPNGHHHPAAAGVAKVYVHNHHRPDVSVAMRAVVLSDAGHGQRQRPWASTGQCAADHDL